MHCGCSFKKCPFFLYFPVGLIRFPVQERLLTFRLYPNPFRIMGLGAMGTTVVRLKWRILLCSEI